MTTESKLPVTKFKLDLTSIIFIVCSIVLFSALYLQDYINLFNTWNTREEYSHGFLIPVLSVFFLWQNKNELSKIPFTGSIFGLFILAFGLLLFFLGKLATLNVIIQYSMLVSITGLLFSFTGFKSHKYLWVPLFFLIFMIPLPPFLYNNLSQKLQLISSELGVAVTRAFGISVYLEGNVIDLGTYKLQVVDACSGLRYLFPLMSFGFICAYLFNAPFWQRAAIFFSTIPVTVLMNSFRIGVIGVLVDRWGTEHAEGFLHDFEGWVIFMACVAILFAEMWLLNKFFSKKKRPLQEVFGLEFPETEKHTGPIKVRKIPKTFVVSLVLLMAAALMSVNLENREEIIPERTTLINFPERLDDWGGKHGHLEEVYLKTLGGEGMTDHIITDYASDAGDKINLYVAYYESQRAGGSIHSPRSCIPGGGWIIKGVTQVPLEGVLVDGKPAMVNRVEIMKGDYKQLVYYWFQQRGRSITNEYQLKWFLFWDSLTQHRSDGALLRLTTSILPNESWEEGDKRLIKFSHALGNKLDGYIPE